MSDSENYLQVLC